MLNIARGTNKEFLKLAQKSADGGKPILLEVEVPKAVDAILVQIEDIAQVEPVELDRVFREYLPGFSALHTNFITVDCWRNGTPSGIVVDIPGVRPLPKVEPAEPEVPADIGLLSEREARHAISKVLMTLPDSGAVTVADVNKLFAHIPGFHAVWKWGIEVRAWSHRYGCEIVLLIDSNLGYRAGITKTRREYSYE